MRIGICFHPNNESGGRRYLEGLVQALSRIRPRHDYLLYWEGAQRPHLQLDGHRFRFRHLLNDTTPTWEDVQRDLPGQLKRDRIDLFHSHFSRFPIEAPCPTIVTLHDAIPALSPQGTIPFRTRRRVFHIYQLAARLANHIIVSSHHTQQLLIQKLDVAASRITRIYPGCPKQFHPISPNHAAGFVRKRFGLRRPYLFSAGEAIPRKNHPLLIRAFRRRLSRNYDLVLVGKSGWWADYILRLIGRDPAIHYLGPVSDDKLLQLYAAAECLVYPSQEEGFGFPPLEAMACGTPVVASNCSSIPEVIGDAGLLVEPGSVRQLADALEKLLENAQLQRVLRERGLRRVRQFCWEETAKKTLAVYQQVASSSP